MPASPETVVQVQNSQPQGVIHPVRSQKTKKKRFIINKLFLSTYFRIGLTFLLLIMLFLTASFIAFQSEQKRKRLEQYEKQIPGAEILIPQKDENSTENWKTYENEELGFTLKYPKEWNEVGTGEFELGSGTKIESADKSFSLGLLTGINKGYSYEKNKEFIYMFKQGGGEVAEVTGGIASKTEVNYQGAKTITSFILSDKNEVYSLSLVSSDKNNLTNSIFDQILSTFRFLD